MARGKGGAMVITGGSVRVSDSSILRSSCLLSDGGAIHVTGGDVTLADASIIDSSAQRYGDAFYLGAGLVMMSNTIVVNSRSETDAGGAMTVMGGIMTVVGGRVDSSSAGGYGGMLYCQGGITNFHGSTVLDSTAGTGGNVIYLAGGQVTVESSRIARSSGGEGCLYLLKGELHLLTSTIERSESSDPNGVILESGSDSQFKLVVITHTEFWQHVCDGTLFSLPTATVVLRNISFTPLPGCDMSALASPGAFAGVASAALSCGDKYRSDVDGREYDVCSSDKPGACVARPVNGTAALQSLICQCPSPQFPNQNIVADAALAPYLPLPSLGHRLAFAMGHSAALTRCVSVKSQ
eukprot:5087192-Prymnesium_polylepis.1